MTTANASPFPRERKLILGLLLILAAASWALLIWQSAAMNSQAMGMGLTSGTDCLWSDSHICPCRAPGGHIMTEEGEDCHIKLSDKKCANVCSTSGHQIVSPAM